uniref:Uncharacterized protein n=1 Tax=Anguilla anguilla TaxID=7936 RepID=A0A0E9VN74_ANGAN
MQLMRQSISLHDARY